ncbi:glycoside hydrolase family 16 protein [Phenylobacterium sp. LjRoot219]|uniref:glycoside hydrolase family 16 protein n=1 Tax=Phenylobacterium sp. LjRoot219 TaxID=3342283 RepID=UPI003ECC635D
MRVSAIAALAAASLTSGPAGAPEAATARPCALHPVLIEDFDDLSIHRNRIGPARWTAHTPWWGDFGDARFADPGPDGPFSVKDGVLSITASKDAEGRWQSGLIAAADSTGAGAGTRYGYFETRMRMPTGAGTWPAFWLAALRPAKTTKDAPVEVDVIEYYGHLRSGYRAVLHVWYRDKALRRGKGHTVEVPEGALERDFHTYGVDISPQAIVFFLDRKPVWSQPTPKELDGPLYPLVNLALGSGFPIDKTPNPSVLRVDYVHVYGRGPGPPGGCRPGLPPASA